MSLLRATSIRQRLMRITAAVTVLTLGLAATLFVVNDVRMLREQMVRDLEVLAAVVGENSRSALVFDAPGTAEKNLASLRRESQIRWAILYDRDGRPFARYLRDPGERPQDPPGSADGVFLDVSVLGLGSVEVASGLELDGEPVGRIFIHARTDALAAQLERYAWWVSLLMILTLGVAMLFAARLQRRIAEPILRLAAGARAVSAGGDYSLRVQPPASDDEIAALFHGFNAMLEQIERHERELNDIRANLERLVAERTRALDASLREQRLILENLPLGVLRIAGRRILDVNPRAAELFGFSQGELVGLSTEQLHPDHAAFEEVGRLAYPTLAAGGVYRDDRLVRRRDGSRFWCRLIGQDVEPGTPDKGSLWILDDIDRDKALEEALRQARATAEAASRAKDAFLANMSHELRTPLGAVLGFVQILERDARLDAGQRRQVQAIRRGGERLLGLISDVLDLARIEAGRLDLQPVAWDSARLLEELSETFRGRTERKGLRLRIDAVPPLPRSLMCDAKCLHQILANLIDNAIKFTERGSVAVTLGHADGDLIATVADTGSGIPEARLAVIFEPFQQLGDAVSRAQGLGLGLAITRRLVERMGGAIAVESTPGVATTFRVRIPAHAVESAGEPPRTCGEPGRVLGYRRTTGTGPLRILITDDEAENREILMSLLAPLGFATAEAATGRDCVRQAEMQPPDLVLMDLRMPEMDGFEAARALRERPALRGVPIVAVTAAAYADDRDRVLAAGLDAHLAKPVLREALLDTLGSLLPLDWERGQPPGEPVPAALERVSRDRTERLQRLTRSGSVTAIGALAADWLREGGCPVLAQRIEALADEFDMAGLRRLAEEVGAAASDEEGE